MEDKYLKNDLPKGLVPQSLHPGCILGSHTQSITPGDSVGDQMLLKMWWNYCGGIYFIGCLKGISSEAKLKYVSCKLVYKQLCS